MLMRPIALCIWTGFFVQRAHAQHGNLSLLAGMVLIEITINPILGGSMGPRELLEGLIAAREFVY